MDLKHEAFNDEEKCSNELGTKANPFHVSAPTSIFGNLDSWAGWDHPMKALSSSTEVSFGELHVDERPASSTQKKKKKGKGRAVDFSPGPVENQITHHALVYPDLSGETLVIEKSPRQKAMENQDILGEIFNIISLDLETPGRNVSQTRKDLFYAARTCRIFLDPAINALWRVLPSLFPLLKLLPSFQLVNNQYRLPDVKAGEWAILEDYARRVRIIVIENTYLRWSVSPLVYFRLNQLRGSSLFPALKELRIPSNVNMDLFSPFSMLSPEMRCLELNRSLISNQELFSPFFSFATTTSPNITHLILRGDVAIDLEPTFLFGSLRVLELELSTQTYDASFYRKLARLTNLRTLILFLGPANVRQRNRQTLNTPQPITGFRPIETLHLKGSLAPMSEALQYISCQSLITWTLEESLHRSHDVQPSNWTECFEALSTCVESVKHVIITQCLSYNYTFPYALITPLYEIRNLEVFELNNGHLTLSESEFLALISAFPKLKRLSLPSMCSGSCPPISVLWQPSIIPPTLEELRFCCFIDGRSAQLPADLKDVKINCSVAHHGLRRLLISSSFYQISDHNVIHVARLLDSAYPNLDVVEGYGPNARIGYESWSRVDLFRAALRDIRCEMRK